MDFERLLSLPDGVIDDLLSCWLTVEDLALGLDVALSQSACRERYLEHLYNASITLPVAVSIEPHAGDCMDRGDILTVRNNIKSSAKKRSHHHHHRTSTRKMSSSHRLRNPHKKHHSEEAAVHNSNNNRNINTNNNNNNNNNNSMNNTDNKHSERDREKDVLYWLFHHNLSVREIHFYRNVVERDLRLIDQGMIDRVRDIVLKLFVVTDLDVYCLATCRALRSLTIDCWIGSSLTDAHMQTICTHCTQIETLKLVQCQAITLSTVELVHRQLRKLQHLTLSLCANIHFASPQHFFDLLGYVPELCVDALYFDDSNASLVTTTKTAEDSVCTLRSVCLPLDMTCLAVSLCPNLQSIVLSISSMSEITESSSKLREIATRCRGLRSIEFTNILRECDLADFFSSLSESRFTLCEVKIAETVISPAMVHSAFSCCPVLEALALHNAQRHFGIDAQLEEGSGRVEQEEDELVHLDALIEGETNEAAEEEREHGQQHEEESARVNRSAIAAGNLLSTHDLAEEDPFASLPTGLERATLRTLSLYQLNFLSDTGALRLSTLCPQLTSLTLSHCQHVSSRALLELSRSFSTLRHLSLSHCHVVDDVALGFLSHNPQLQEMDVSGCVHLSDRFLREGILQRENDLRLLDISEAQSAFSLEGISELFAARLDQYLHKKPCFVKLEKIVLFNGNRTHRLLENIYTMHKAVGLREPLIEIEREVIY